MHNPPHPGAIIKHCLYNADISIKDAAKDMDISQELLSAIIKGKEKISQDTAKKLAEYFGTTAQSWINQQVVYDEWVKGKDKQ